ncbi:hypothetical protein DSECCO2_610830 [anaerobic digester metagenome]
MVEHAEIAVGRFALDAAGDIEADRLLQALQTILQMRSLIVQGWSVDLAAMVSQGPLHDASGVDDLGADDGPGHLCAYFRRIRPAILLTSEQDITGNRPLHPGQKAPVLGQKTEAQPSLGGKSHQERAARDMAKTDDTAKGMHRHAQPDFVVHAHGHTFPVLG